MNDSQLHFLISFILTALTVLVTFVVLQRRNGVLLCLGMSGTCFVVLICFICVGSKEAVDIIVNRWNLSQQDLFADCFKDLSYNLIGVVCGGVLAFCGCEVSKCCIRQE